MNMNALNAPATANAVNEINSPNDTLSSLSRRYGKRLCMRIDMSDYFTIRKWPMMLRLLILQQNQRAVVEGVAINEKRRIYEILRFEWANYCSLFCREFPSGKLDPKQGETHQKHRGAAVRNRCFRRASSVVVRIARAAGGRKRYHMQAHAERAAIQTGDEGCKSALRADAQCFAKPNTIL